MKLKRIIAMCMAVVLCLSFATVASAATNTEELSGTLSGQNSKDANDFTDYDAGAWYAAAVGAAVENGLLYGKSSKVLDPNGYLTRAEMAAVINRSFGTYKTTNVSKYTDVSPNAWYYKDVQMAVWMGTYEGQSETIMAPESPITRQEIMTVVARALQLDLNRYEDYTRISNWALPYVSAMVGAGYIQGRENGLAPQENITRAEFAQVFHNVVSAYIGKAGTYDGTLDGNLLIRTNDVVLKDATINGDLIIGNGAKDGKVTLSNVKITGRLVVWGGGTEAVYCNDGTDVEELIVCRVDGPVKVIFDRDSTLRVYDTIQVEITKRAEAYEETEVVFYDVEDLLQAQKDLNEIVNENLIQVTVSDHLYGLVDSTEVKVDLENHSETDTYKIEIIQNETGKAIAEAVELAPGRSCKTMTLSEIMAYGDYGCTAIVTAFRGGKTVGTLEIETVLHIAYLWALED